MVGERYSIFRTATCPNQMPKKAEKAAITPRVLIVIYLP